MWSRRLYLPALWAATALLSGACAVVPRSPEALATPIRISGHSYNLREVDVYMTCGIHEGRWLGSIPKRGTAAFEIPPEEARCTSGRKFFLAMSNRAGTYWARPVRLQGGDRVDLVIERFLGRSSARVHGNFR
ncbi:MAG: hypothetical protein ACREM9_11405 [Gemmatimonadales bacterium]